MTKITVNDKPLNEQLVRIGLKHKSKEKLIIHTMFYCRSNTKQYSDEEYKNLSKREKEQNIEKRNAVFEKAHYQFKLAASTLTKQGVKIDENSFKEFVLNKLKLKGIFK